MLGLQSGRFHYRSLSNPFAEKRFGEMFVSHGIVGGTCSKLVSMRNSAANLFFLSQHYSQHRPLLPMWHFANKGVSITMKTKDGG